MNIYRYNVNVHCWSSILKAALMHVHVNQEISRVQCDSFLAKVVGQLPLTV